ncbi:MAG: hypothetical protein H7067_11625 [Burkholderiales bacterium]|nr:hypothetical protein [Opitutaceae bacterium]
MRPFIVVLLRSLLLTSTALPVIAGSPESGWTFHGYAVEGETEWFSLRDPQGGALWTTQTAPGAVSVTGYDPQTRDLIVRINGATTRIRLSEAQTATIAASSFASASAGTVSPSNVVLPPLRAGDGNRESPHLIVLERLRISAAASRVEKEEQARAQDLQLVASGKTRSPSLSVPLPTPATVPAVDTATNMTTPSLPPAAGEPDWPAIHRQVAERRAQKEIQWAAERLARAEGRGP